MELGKLSVHFNLVHLEDKISTTLLGVGKMNILNINLDTVFNGLNDKEKEVLEYVRKNFFAEVGNAHWEGRELKEYNETMKQ